MDPEGPVTRWIFDQKIGHRAVAVGVREGYFHGLVTLAVFDRFVLRAERGPYPKRNESVDYWQRLFRITAQKAVDLIRRKVQPTERDSREKSRGNQTEREVCPEPIREFSALVAQECRRLLGR